MRRSLLRRFCFDENQQYMEDSMFVKDLAEAGHTFKIFRDPRFYYSLRRIKKVGNLKMLLTMLQYQIHYLRGGDFSKPFSAANYPMLGGKFYEPDAKSKRWFTTVPTFVKNASRKQLEQAKHIVELIKEG